MLKDAFAAQGIDDDAGRKSLAKKVGHGSGAIHSSSSKGCVATSNFSGKSIDGGWNRVGLWNAISYGEEIDRILNGQDKDEGGETVMATAIVTA